MNTNRRGVQVFRWLSAAMLVLVALYSFNLAAYHYWAAGGPPTPNPEWHAARGNRFFWISLFALGSAVGVVRLLRKRQPRDQA